MANKFNKIKLEKLSKKKKTKYLDKNLNNIIYSNYNKKNYNLNFYIDFLKN